MAETTPKVAVVEATETDAVAVGDFFWEMWHQAGPDAPGFAGASRSVIAEIAAPEAIAARVGGPERRMFIAVADDAVVGFAATRVTNPTEIELAGIVVLQTMVGSGIGTPLLEAAVESAKSAGFELMTVSTEASNDQALGFYRARGFEFKGNATTKVEGIEVLISTLAKRL